MPRRIHLDRDAKALLEEAFREGLRPQQIAGFLIDRCGLHVPPRTISRWALTWREAQRRQAIMRELPPEAIAALQEWGEDVPAVLTLFERIDTSPGWYSRLRGSAQTAMRRFFKDPNRGTLRVVKEQLFLFYLSTHYFVRGADSAEKGRS